MIVTIVEVYVKKDKIDEFIQATLENHKNSIKEKGNLRFDVLQSTEDPTRFTLYEAYDSEETAKEHKKTSHYLKWRETVDDFMAQPRRGILHKVIAPLDKSFW
ncbi:MAG: antibiotic biosynthesis monooxygenase [Candidatus Omnitrophica bacterium]|nr:antibiotic biosynthesis monooxygenase [Candidatus Omnitrophota bacterium]